MQSRLKRLTKLGISLTYFAVCYVRDVLHCIRGSKPRPTCSILYYHSISREDRERFAAQMNLMLKHATPIRADSHRPLVAGNHYSVVTFDDGYQDVIDNALPALYRKQIPCTIFVIAGALGTVPPWDRIGKSSGCTRRIMSLAQLQGISSEQVTIGAHTVTHPRLPGIPGSEVVREILGSRLKLEALLHRSVTLFSFPYGAFNDDLVDYCREAGFERAFTSLPYLAFSDPGEYLSGRIGVEPADWHIEFVLKVLGAYRWMPAAISMKRQMARSPIGRLVGGSTSREVAHTQPNSVARETRTASIRD